MIPVRPDLQQVDGLKSFACPADIPVQLDLAIIFRRAAAAPLFVAEAASKRVEAVCLPPGVWTRQAEKQAREHDLLLIKNRCIEEDHRHMSKGGYPARLGIQLSRLRRTYEDNRKNMEEEGYAAGGGGGRKGGGKRSVLDEKKIVRGRPSPRQGSPQATSLEASGNSCTDGGKFPAKAFSSQLAIAICHL